MSLTINNGLIFGLEPKEPPKRPQEEPEPIEQEEELETNEEQIISVDDGANIH